MRRRLFMLLSALSLLLCVASVATRTWGLFEGDEITVEGVTAGEPRKLRLVTFASGAGGVRLSIQFEAAPNMVLYSGPGSAVMPGAKPFGDDGWRYHFSRQFPPVYPVNAYATAPRTIGGFQWVHEGRSSAPNDYQWYQSFTVPAWLLILAFAILPASGVFPFVRRRLGRPPQDGTRMCDRCGYDLRASPGRCPECGDSPKRRPV
jgi:hypothetical protein